MTDQLVFNNAKILIVGDVMLDVYKYGKAICISPEAPIPVVLISRKESKAGGAANVGVNLRQIGCGVVKLVGYVGEDYAGDQLIDIISKNGIDSDNLIVSTTSTITKTRILADRQHIIRYDDDSSFGTQSHRKRYESVLIQQLKNLSDNQSFDIVIVSDYNKGTITNKVMETIKLCFPCPIICDFKPINSALFHDVFCITPNLDEAKLLIASYKYENLYKLIVKIKQLLKVKSVVITLSHDGICFLDQNDDYHKLDARVIINSNDPMDRLDVTGAGDTVLSVLAVCLATGYSLAESVRLSNLAAGVVVRKIGTAVCSIEELQRENKI